MLSNTVSPLQKQEEAVHLPNSLQKLISQIHCPAKKKKISENNPLQIRRIRNGNEGNTFAKLYLEPNRKDVIKRKHKDGSWIPPHKINDESSETNYSQLPNTINDQKPVFSTSSSLQPANTSCTNNQNNSTIFKHPDEVDRSVCGNSFKYPKQEVTNGTEPRYLGNKRVERILLNTDVFANEFDFKPDTESVPEQMKQQASNFNNSRKTPALFPTADVTETNTACSKVDRRFDSNDILIQEFSNAEKEFKMPINTVADNAMKSSIKTNFNNNRKKWVTFNDIIENNCEQNFVDELYDEGSNSQAKDESENAESSKHVDNENLVADVRIQNARVADSDISIPARTDQQKLSDLIQQVQRMNEMITKARNEILKFGYAPNK